MNNTKYVYVIEDFTGKAIKAFSSEEKAYKFVSQKVEQLCNSLPKNQVPLSSYGYTFIKLKIE